MTGPSPGGMAQGPEIAPSALVGEGELRVVENGRVGVGAAPESDL